METWHPRIWKGQNKISSQWNASGQDIRLQDHLGIIFSLQEQQVFRCSQYGFIHIWQLFLLVSYNESHPYDAALQLMNGPACFCQCDKPANCSSNPYFCKCLLPLHPLKCLAKQRERWTEMIWNQLSKWNWKAIRFSSIGPSSCWFP